MKRNLVSNKIVEAAMQRRFDKMHRDKMKQTKPTIDLKPVSNIMRRFDAKKALMEKERRIEIVRMNHKLNKKIRAMTTKNRAQTRPSNICQFRSKLMFSMKGRLAKLNAQNRALSERLRKARSCVVVPTRVEKKEKNSGVIEMKALSKSQAFGISLAWGRQMSTAISHSPTKKVMTLLKYSDGLDGVLPRTGLDGKGIPLPTASKKTATTISRCEENFWSVYVFDVASSEDGAKSKGVNMRVVSSFGGDGKVKKLAKSYVVDVSLSDVLKLYASLSPVSSSRLAEALATSTGIRLSDADINRQELVSILVHSLRYYRGRIWLDGTATWNRVRSHDDAVSAKALKDARLYCQKRERIRTAKRLEELRRSDLVSPRRGTPATRSGRPKTSVGKRPQHSHGRAFAVRPTTTSSSRGSARILWGTEKKKKKNPEASSALERRQRGTNEQALQRQKEYLRRIGTNVDTMRRATSKASISYERILDRLRATTSESIRFLKHLATTKSTLASSAAIAVASAESARNMTESARDDARVCLEEARRILRSWTLEYRKLAKQTTETGASSSSSLSEGSVFKAAKDKSDDAVTSVERAMSAIVDRLHTIEGAVREMQTRVATTREESQSKQKIAAIKIQAIHRGKSSRSLQTKRQGAATALQSLHRGRKVRNRARKKHTHAARLQALHRGYAQRKKIRSQRKAAMKIQSICRGRRARATSAEILRESSSLDDAAVRCIYRGAMRVGSKLHLVRLQHSTQAIGNADDEAVVAGEPLSEILFVTDSETGEESSFWVGESAAMTFALGKNKEARALLARLLGIPDDGDNDKRLSGRASGAIGGG
eukprot:g228.t1